MNARSIVVGFVLSLSFACDDDDDGMVDDDCDARIDDPAFDMDEETCKAVGLIVDCLDEEGVDAEALTDAQLETAIDDCAAKFNFCYVNPAIAGQPEAVTFLELRDQSNMCVG